MTGTSIPLPRLAAIDRRQITLRTVDVELLIHQDHGARSIWELVGRLDLSLYGNSQCLNRDPRTTQTAAMERVPDSLVPRWVISARPMQPGTAARIHGIYNARE